MSADQLARREADLPDGQTLVRRPRRSAMYSGNARAVFDRGMKSQWQGNLWVMVSGFAEPVLYLLAMGLGLGAMIGTITDDSGRVVEYAAYIAPALLATSAMNGAIYDATWNVFFKLKISRIYEGMLSTSLGPMDVALGEIAVALVRGGVYCVGFISVMLVMGVITSWWALLAVPACLLIAFGFAALGMAATSFLTTFQQMDWLGLVLMPMFLFSGTFYPLSVYPDAIAFLVRLLPLWHGIELLRNLCSGDVSWATGGHALYFVVLAALGTWAASARLKSLFLR